MYANVLTEVKPNRSKLHSLSVLYFMLFYGSPVELVTPTAVEVDLGGDAGRTASKLEACCGGQISQRQIRITYRSERKNPRTYDQIVSTPRSHDHYQHGRLKDNSCLCSCTIMA